MSLFQKTFFTADPSEPSSDSHYRNNIGNFVINVSIEEKKSQFLMLFLFFRESPEGQNTLGSIFMYRIQKPIQIEKKRHFRTCCKCVFRERGLGSLLQLE